MRIGILTGGGDCGGINALIRAAVRRASDLGFEVIGIRRGWAGLVEPDTFNLAYDSVAEIVSQGGTVLLTSRTNPLKRDGGAELVLENVRQLKLDAVLAIGGEDTLGVAHELAKRGFKFVGAPKTMDNDLSGTDFTFGFDSAVNVAVEAMDRICTTGKSHERVMVVEVMGRDAGWVAMHAGIAGGAHMIFVPEQPIDIDQVCKTLEERKERGERFSLIVVAEGARLGNLSRSVELGEKVDEFGHPRLGGIATLLAQEVRKRTGMDTREVILGHVLRGGPPSSFDRVLATRIGVAAVDLIKEGKFDMMPALKGNGLVPIPVAQALPPKPLDLELLEVARMFS